MWLLTPSSVIVCGCLLTAFYQAILDEQQHSLKEEMAKQAEARLQYLLRQSDIFQHFGLQVPRTRHQPRRRHIPRATSTTHLSL